MSADEPAAIAGWKEAQTNGPWQVYSEQDGNTAKFQYLGDTETVSLDWCKCVLYSESSFHRFFVLNLTFFLVF